MKDPVNEEYLEIQGPASATAANRNRVERDSRAENGTIRTMNCAYSCTSDAPQFHVVRYWISIFTNIKLLIY